MRIQSPLPLARRKARIEIIPLIDVVFFLLATFIMVSLSMVKNQGISVNLPSATTASAEDRKASVIISVDKDGSVYLDKEQISIEALKGKLQTLKINEPDLRVFINGDDHAYFGKAVSIFDEVRAAGITKVSIQTKSKS